MDRITELKEAYALSPHPEGGWFSEVYTAPFVQGGRALAGSIYFMLCGNDISHFHQIDCDEIWYYHEGCGLKITVMQGGKYETLLLGADPAAGQRAMAVIPAGAVFAAENIDADGYTFLSCATTPAFSYDGFRLIGQQELRDRFPAYAESLVCLAFESGNQADR